MRNKPGTQHMTHFESSARLLMGWSRHALFALLAGLLLSPVVAYAADTQCAKGNNLGQTTNCFARSQLNYITTKQLTLMYPR